MEKEAVIPDPSARLTSRTESILPIRLRVAEQDLTGGLTDEHLARLARADERLDHFDARFFEQLDAAL